jgi:hypothetical protein
MSDLLSLALFFFGAALIYAFRGRVFAPFRRFEARNALRRAEEARAMVERDAHYRHTLQSAQEQFEAVTKIAVPDERTGEPVERFLFLGIRYATREDAEAARQAAIVDKAREFYRDLDQIYLSRRPRRG